MLFSITMTIGRLSGDFVVARVGDRAVLFWGSLFAIAGRDTDDYRLCLRCWPCLDFCSLGSERQTSCQLLFRRGGDADG